MVFLADTAPGVGAGGFSWTEGVRDTVLAQLTLPPQVANALPRLGAVAVLKIATLLAYWTVALWASPALLAYASVGLLIT